MSFIWKGFKKFDQIKNGYNHSKQRDQRDVRVYDTGKIHQTNYFLRDDGVFTEGGQLGKCGFKKDHRRVFLCPSCYNKKKYLNSPKTKKTKKIKKKMTKSTRTAKSSSQSSQSQSYQSQSSQSQGSIDNSSGSQQ